VLIFGGVATLVVGFLLISHFAIAPPADRFKDFTDTVETRLQRPQAGFAFGKLTRSTAGINTFNIAAIRVEATRQSDHASVAFKFQYLFEEGHWRLEDAEVSGDEAAKEAAENELARGSESDLLAVFAPVDGPRFAFYRNRARAGVAEGEYDRAIACCNEALRLGPRDAELHLLRGSALAAKGEFEEAVADCSEALRLEPGNACAFSLRGAAWADMRDYDKAHQDCGEALRLDPKAAIAWAIRAAVWLQEGDYGKAIEDANQALQADPYLAWAYSIRGTGRLKNLIEFGSAVEDCRTAIRLDPDEAWNYQSLAQIQATCPDGTYRDAAAALENANQAMTLLKASDIGRWRVVDTLAAAYAEGGQFDQAVEWQNKAIELLAKDQYATDQDKAELRSRLELYKQGKPYRQEPKKQ
jgi:tetratricopeptide (TPR) repeat protein